MPLLTANNTTIHYTDSGDGDVLVLIHGLAATTHMWQPQVEAFSKEYRVIAIDARGVGKSGKLTGWRHILSRQASDLKALLDHLQIDKATICGVSYGGVLTQQFVSMYPEKCRAIAIIDSYATTRVTNFKELIWLINVYLGATSNLTPRKWLAAIMRNVYRRWPTASRVMSEVALQYRGYEAMKTRIAINNVDFIPQLEKVTVPALCAVGATSWWLSIPFMEKCAHAIPTCKELHIIPDSFDPSNLCQVEKFNELLKEFLAQLK